MLIELRDADQLNPSVNIEVLPSTVLLEIFSFYMGRPDAREDVWHTLVYVCRQRRFVVFDSPRRLNLLLLCTPKRPLKMLDIWPALPIVIDFLSEGEQPEGMADIVAAQLLKQHCRVRRIDIQGISNSLMKEFAAMKKPFPQLTALKLDSNQENVPILPESFLGGSAPRLWILNLDGIPFPAVKELPLSCRNLVALRLWSIPHSGYISPEAEVTCLSALTGLRVFFLGFRSPQSPVGRGTQRLPPLTRIVLAALTKFAFRGNCEYLEDIVSLVDTPLLNHFKIIFFNQLIFHTPQLRLFISRTEMIKPHYRATVTFYNRRAEVRVSPPEGTAVHEGLFLEVSCPPSDWQLSSLSQLCSSSLPPLSTLEHLKILSSRSHWEDDFESTQWLELLYSFASVNNLVLARVSALLVAPALRGLTGGSMTEVLPMLQCLHIEGRQRSNRVKEIIEPFIAARQLSGHPVAILCDEVR